MLPSQSLIASLSARGNGYSQDQGPVHWADGTVAFLAIYISRNKAGNLEAPLSPQSLGKRHWDCLAAGETRGHTTARSGEETVLGRGPLRPPLYKELFFHIPHPCYVLQSDRKNFYPFCVCPYLQARPVGSVRGSNYCGVTVIQNTSCKH